MHLAKPFRTISKAALLAVVMTLLAAGTTFAGTYCAAAGTSPGSYTWDTQRLATVDAAFFALRALPSDDELDAMVDADQRSALTRMKELAENGLNADKMTDSEFQAYAFEVQEFTAGLQYTEKLDGQVQTTPNCTRQCRLNMQECYDENVPPNAPRWPCFDCVACNLEYFACLAGCVYHG
jgi:hypothetical protein